MGSVSSVSEAMMACFKATILLLCLAVLRTDASCFGRDASFSRGAKPVVTQPSRNDPSKVMVDWSKIVTNTRCVDKFVVWMWPDGTERSGKTTVKKEVSKTTMSAIMDMEACVNYRFAVELDEKEMTGNKKFSGEQLFKTAGVTKVEKGGHLVDDLRHHTLICFQKMDCQNKMTKDRDWPKCIFVMLKY